jgi:hypothetical protein
LAATLAGAFALAAAGAWLVVPGLPGAILALLLVALGAATLRDRAMLKARRSPQAIELRAGGGGAIELADGRRIELRGEGHLVHRACVILALRNRIRGHLLVPAGMLDADAFRRLRQWGLWGRYGAAARPMTLR